MIADCVALQTPDISKTLEKKQCYNVVGQFIFLLMDSKCCTTVCVCVVPLQNVHDCHRLGFTNALTLVQMVVILPTHLRSLPELTLLA